jgi:hypothetical protein
MGKCVRTCGGKKDRHFKGLCLDDVRAGARACRGESARDSVYTVQRARKDEVLVRGEL